MASLTTPPLPPVPPLPPLDKHSPLEDFQGIVTGTLFVSLAMVLYKEAGLLTGSTAGLAFILHYLTGISFGKLFFAINVPFYWFAWRQMGPEFTLKTFAAFAVLALLVDNTPKVLDISGLHPLYAALVGGLLLGSGCLFLARHRASLGGATIVSLYMQEKHGIRAGKVQMGIDCVIVALALLVVPADRVAYSVLGAVVMSAFLWINHKPGRYRAV